MSTQKTIAMFAVLCLIALGLGYWVGQPKDPDTANATNHGAKKPTQDTEKPNPNDAAGEFLHIFDGATMKDWSADIPGVWSVQSGRLVGNTVDVFKGVPYLAHYRELGDFELKARVKINGSGNSGIFFRAPAGATVANPQNAYEVQIIGRERLNSVNDQYPTGSLYGRAASFDLVGGDEWFDVHIEAVQNRIKVSIDGREVVNFTDPDADYPRRGYIKLQTMQDTDVQFMDFQLKQLNGDG